MIIEGEKKKKEKRRRSEKKGKTEYIISINIFKDHPRLILFYLIIIYQTDNKGIIAIIILIYLIIIYQADNKDTIAIIIIFIYNSVIYGTSNITLIMMAKFHQRFE